jgi:hypothetical protein
VTNDPNRVSSERLDRDVQVLWRIVLRQRRGRGKPPAGSMSALSEYLEWLQVLIRHQRERRGMAKANNTQSTWRGFVECKLTEVEKETYGQWDVHDDDLFVLLSDAVASGHKLSITFNKQNDQFVASFTGNEGTGKHEGYTLSAYASDWYNALRVLLFKHSVLLDARWETAAERPTESIG